MKNALKFPKVLVCLLAVMLAVMPFAGVYAEEADETDAKINTAYQAMQLAEAALNKANEELAKAEADFAAADAAMKEAQNSMNIAKAAMEAAGLTEDSDIDGELSQLSAKLALLQAELQALPLAVQAEITAADAQIALKESAISTQQENVDKALEGISDLENDLLTNANNTTTATNDKASFEELINNAEKTLLPALNNEKAALDAQLKKDQAAYDDLEPNIERLREAAENAESAEKYYDELEAALKAEQEDQAALQKTYDEAEAALQSQKDLLKNKQNALAEEEAAFPAEKEQLEAEKAAAQEAYDKIVEDQKTTQGLLDTAQAIVNSSVAKAARDYGVGKSAELAEEIAEYQKQLDENPAKVTEKQNAVDEQYALINGADGILAQIAANNAAKAQTETDLTDAKKAHSDAVAAFESDSYVAELNATINALDGENGEIAKLEDDIEALEARAEYLNETLIPDVTALENEIRTLDADIEEDKSNLASAKSALDYAQEAYDKNGKYDFTGLIKKALDAAKAAYEDAEKALDETQKTRDQKQQQLDTLLNGKTLENLNDEYQTLTTAETGTIAQKNAVLAQKRNTLAQTRQDLTDYLDEQNSDIEDLNDEVERLEALLEEQKQTADNLTIALENAEIELDNRETALANQQAVASELQKKISDAQKSKSYYDSAISYYDDAVVAVAQYQAEMKQQEQDAKDKQDALEAATEELEERIAANAQMKEDVRVLLEETIPAQEQDLADKKTTLDEQKAETQKQLDALNEWTQDGTIDYEALKAAAAAALEAAENSLEADKARLQAAIDKDTADLTKKTTEIENLEKQIETWNDEVAKLTAKLEKLATDKQNNETKLEQKKAELGAEEDPATADTLYGKLNKLNSELASLQASKKALEDKLADIDNSEEALKIKQQIADVEAQMGNYDGDSKLIAAYVSAKATYTSKKVTYETAKLTRDGLALAVIPLQLAYDEAYSYYQQLIGSDDCGHEKFKVTVFGNTFCPLKAINLCTHNLGSCCDGMNTTAIANTIKSYIESGDFAGLANEAKNVYAQAEKLVANYEELPESVRATIESTVKSLIKKAVDAAGNKLMGEENWAALSELAKQLMDDAQREALVQKLEDKIINEVKQAVEQYMASEDYAAIKPYVDVAIEVAKKIAPYFEGFDVTEDKIEDVVRKIARDYIAKAKAEIMEKVEDIVDEYHIDEVIDMLKKVAAAVEEMKQHIPTAGEIEAALQQLKAEVYNKLNELALDMIEKAKAEAMAKIEEALKKTHIDEAIEALKQLRDLVEKLHNKLPEYSEIKDAAADFIKEAAAKINQKLAAHIKAQVKEIIEKSNIDEIVAELNKVVDYVKELAAKLPELDLSVEDVKAYAKEALYALAAKAKAEVKELIEAVKDSECYDHIAAKAEELIAKLEGLLEDIHVCEKSVEQIAAECYELVAKYAEEMIAYAEGKLSNVNCESVKAKLAQLCAAMELVMNWRPDCDLTQEEVEAMIAEALAEVKNFIEEAVVIAKEIIKEILGHTVIVDEAVAPTCGEDGLTEGKHCVCGYVIVAQEIVPATGEHNWNEGEVTTQPQPGVEGEKTYTCTECGETTIESVPALPTRVPGDADDDGKVTLADLQAVLRRVAGHGNKINESNADVDQSGSFGLADVQLMLRYFANHGVTLL